MCHATGMATISICQCWGCVCVEGCVCFWCQPWTHTRIFSHKRGHSLHQGPSSVSRQVQSIKSCIKTYYYHKKIGPIAGIRVGPQLPVICQITSAVRQKCNKHTSTMVAWFIHFVLSRIQLHVGGVCVGVCLGWGLWGVCVCGCGRVGVGVCVCPVFSSLV